MSSDSAVIRAVCDLRDLCVLQVGEHRSSVGAADQDHSGRTGLSGQHRQPQHGAAHGHRYQKNTKVLLCSSQHKSWKFSSRLFKPRQVLVDWFRADQRVPGPSCSLWAHLPKAALLRPAATWAPDQGPPQVKTTGRLCKKQKVIRTFVNHDNTGASSGLKPDSL